MTLNHESHFEFETRNKVTAKLIQSCYDEQLQKYIHFKLNPMRKADIGLYLREAMRLYQLTSKLSETLSKYRPGGDATFTKKLQRAIFEPFTSRQGFIEYIGTAHFLRKLIE